MRRIKFRDTETHKTLALLTQNTVLTALTVCTLSKGRWQVDHFLNWIEQHQPKEALTEHEPAYSG